MSTVAVARFYESTIGKKAVMAVTGLILFGFLIAHMLGNLQIFLGRAVMNHYAETLHGNLALLWTVRIDPVDFGRAAYLGVRPACGRQARSAAGGLRQTGNVQLKLGVAHDDAERADHRGVRHIPSSASHDRHDSSEVRRAARI